MTESPLASQPVVHGFFDPATSTVSYIVHDPATGTAAIIDPVLDFTLRNGRTSTASADALLATVELQGLTLAWLLETHAHADHLSSAHYLREQTGAPVVIGTHITDVRPFLPTCLKPMMWPAIAAPSIDLWVKAISCRLVPWRSMSYIRRDTRRPASLMSSAMPQSSATRSSCLIMVPRGRIFPAGIHEHFIVQSISYSNCRRQRGCSQAMTICRQRGANQRG
jgi:hypothetical protein